jgi:hypothetical protein
VDVARLLDPRQVLGAEDRSLAQVGAEVVDEHPTDHVRFPGRCAKSVSFHLLAA